jgi:hypothetical protein
MFVWWELTELTVAESVHHTRSGATSRLSAAADSNSGDLLEQVGGQQLLYYGKFKIF